MISLIEDPSGSMLTKDDISFDEFSEFVSTFTAKQVEVLKEAISKFATIYYKEEVICPVCKTKNQIEYKNLIDFFV
jgi:arabinogalactan endo-1,4-beta-galactosidase